MSLAKEIQSIICKAELRKGNLVAENVTNFFKGECDVLSLSKAGYTHEFEVKVSRSDFKADFKKRKWREFDNNKEYNLPNYFTYVCPSGKITVEDLQPYMGLIYIEDGQLVPVRKPKLIHKSKRDYIQLLTKMFTVLGWHHYFGCQKLTFLAREAKASNDPQLHDAFISAIKGVQERKKKNECSQCTTPFTNEVDAVGCCEGIKI